MTPEQDQLFAKINWILLTPRPNNGYMYVSLGIGPHRRKLMSIHRLVAMAFIPNPENLPEVHHENRDRGDNRVQNLRWITLPENRRMRSLK
jgi:hypothetical protein